MLIALFYTFLLIFIAAAIITLLGIAGFLQIEKCFLDILFKVLLVQLIGSVIALFAKTTFFNGKIRHKLLLSDRELFTKSGDPHTFTIEIYNTETDKKKVIPMEFRRDNENGCFCAFVKKIKENDLVRVLARNSKGKKWESEYYFPNTIEIKMKK